MEKASTKRIKYSYSLNENNELVHISSVTKENRHSHTYICLECGQKLVARIGDYKVKHFAHAPNTVCDGESYLHKLAKRRILEHFMSADTFPLTFVRNVPCKEAKECKFHQEDYCATADVRIRSNLRKWEGKVVYDTCKEEVTIENFRPDLLLSCKDYPDKPPVFIEVFVTHESEYLKLCSKYRIIETTKITSEADIDDIIERGFVEGENCQTYNFHPKLPVIKSNGIPIDRFVLFKSGACMMHKAYEYSVTCENLNQKVHSNSIKELNMVASIDVWGDNESENKLDSYQTGLVYLRKKGLQFRNCILCRFYKLTYTGDDHICILYKTLGASTKRPQQSQASNCPRYEENPELMNHPLTELEKDITEVPG